MIIDLTRPKTAIPVDEKQSWNSFQEFRNEEFQDAGSWPDDKYWEARDEWVEFVKARVSEPYSRDDAVHVVEAALLDEHMRVVLKRASCRQIRPEVVKIIDNLDVLSNPIEAMAGSHFIETAAARIVDLDSQERKKRAAEREADHD